MDVFLLIVAGCVIYFLYTTLQDYLRNPLVGTSDYAPPVNEPRSMGEGARFIDQSLEPMEKLRKSEFGTLAALLGAIAKSDGSVCLLESALRDSILNDMEKDSFGRMKFSDLKAVFDDPRDDVETLALRFKNHTKGEYKKRLKVLEFLFAFAWADGAMDEKEREILLDVGAYFEIENEDFNAIYDDFESSYATENAMDLKTARAIFGFENKFSAAELKDKYQALVAEKKQDILESKNIDKSFKEQYLSEIKEVDLAYKTLSEHLKKGAENKE